MVFCVCTGGDKTGAVLVTCYRLLCLGVDGVTLPGHSGASIYVVSLYNTRCLGLLKTIWWVRCWCICL